MQNWNYRVKHKLAKMNGIMPNNLSRRVGWITGTLMSDPPHFCKKLYFWGIISMLTWRLPEGPIQNIFSEDNQVALFQIKVFPFNEFLFLVDGIQKLVLIGKVVELGVDEFLFKFTKCQSARVHRSFIKGKESRVDLMGMETVVVSSNAETLFRLERYQLASV